MAVLRIIGDREGCFLHRVFVDFNSDLGYSLGFRLTKIYYLALYFKKNLRKMRFWILWSISV